MHSPKGPLTQTPIHCSFNRNHSHQHLPLPSPHRRKRLHSNDTRRHRPRSRRRVARTLRLPGALRLQQLAARAARKEAGRGAGADDGLRRAALAAEVVGGAARGADGAYDAGGLHR